MTAPAMYVSQQTGYPVDYILSQWYEESGGGTSEAALLNNNYAGITPTNTWKAGKDTAYAGFSSVKQFADAYANLLNSPRYATAKKLANSGASVESVFTALQQEGYASDKAYGSKIAAVWASLTGGTIGNTKLTAQPTSSGNVSISASGLEGALLNNAINTSSTSGFSLFRPGTWLPYMAELFVGVALSGLIVYAGITAWKGN